MTEDIAIDSDEFFHNQVMEEEAYRVFYRAIEHLPPQMRNVINYALEGLKMQILLKKWECPRMLCMPIRKRRTRD